MRLVAGHVQPLDAAVVVAPEGGDALALAQVVDLHLGVGRAARAKGVVAQRHELDREDVASVVSLEVGQLPKPQRVPELHVEVVGARQQQAEK